MSIKDYLHQIYIDVCSNHLWAAELHYSFKPACKFIATLSLNTLKKLYTTVKETVSFLISCIWDSRGLWAMILSTLLLISLLTPTSHLSLSLHHITSSITTYIDNYFNPPVEYSYYTYLESPIIQRTALLVTEHNAKIDLKKGGVIIFHATPKINNACRYKYQYNYNNQSSYKGYMPMKHMIIKDAGIDRVFYNYPELSLISTSEGNVDKDGNSNIYYTVTMLNGRYLYSIPENRKLISRRLLMFYSELKGVILDSKQYSGIKVEVVSQVDYELVLMIIGDKGVEYSLYQPVEKWKDINDINDINGTDGEIQFEGVNIKAFKKSVPQQVEYVEFGEVVDDGSFNMDELREVVEGDVRVWW